MKIRKTIKNYLESHEKSGMISRKPHPIIPLIISLLFAILAIISTYNYKLLSSILYSLTIFSLIFSFMHFIITEILASN